MPLPMVSTLSDSKVLFYPNGMNLLANASSLAFGVVLAPITWLFGPIAALNVALTLSPALSALAMFVLLRRWVSWSPASFAGGLLYGFSPLALYQLTNAHLMIGMAAVPPLVVLCLDELLIRQQRSAVKTGVILGLLVTLQFFIGTEVLLMMAVTGLAGLVVVVGYAAWQHPDALKRNARYASVGLCAALVTAAILLAYPAWFALDGPSHFTGAIWQAFNLQSGGNTLSRLLVPEVRLLGQKRSRHIADRGSCPAQVAIQGSFSLISTLDSESLQCCSVGSSLGDATEGCGSSAPLPWARSYYPWVHRRAACCHGSCLRTCRSSRTCLRADSFSSLTLQSR